jgi:hypothetical protein
LAQTLPATDLPPPPLLNPGTPAQRPAPVPQPPAQPVEAPSLESLLQPDLKPLPKDPTERAIENTRRLLRERDQKTEAQRRNESAAPAAGNPGVVIIFGERPAPAPGVGEQVDRVLNPQSEGITTETLPGGMVRRECVADCTGPACCVLIERDVPTFKRDKFR